MIKLELTAYMKDGGSKKFFGSDGKEYWQCHRLGKEYASHQGVLFEGNPNNKPDKKAVGEFVLTEQGTSKFMKIKTRLIQK